MTQGMLQVAMLNRGSADHKTAVRNRVFQAAEFFGVRENFRCRPDRRARFSECEFERIHDPQVRRAEVTHGSRSGAKIQRIASRDKHYPQSIEIRE